MLNDMEKIEEALRIGRMRNPEKKAEAFKAFMENILERRGHLDRQREWNCAVDIDSLVVMASAVVDGWGLTEPEDFIGLADMTAEAVKHSRKGMDD